jgi:biotin transport system ATP-binding protein
MIRAEALHFAYHPGKPILEDVRFVLESGRILGLVGANGTGKSTLLALLAGLFPPSSGLLHVAGMDAATQGGDIRRKTALVLQEADLTIIGSTVAEDLCLGLPLERHPEALALAHRLGLVDPRTPVHILSHGQKRKLCLAAALLRKPQLLLLDEPFAGLDYPGIREFRALLKANREAGLTQIIAVHDLEPLADLADVWLVLAQGRQAAWGSSQEIFPRLEKMDVRPPCSWIAGLGVMDWDTATIIP